MILQEPQILLVDGDYDECETLADALNRCGFRADCANDVQTAQEFAGRRPYSVLLLVHWPPFLDATATYHRLRDLLPQAETVFIESVPGAATVTTLPDIRSVHLVTNQPGRPSTEWLCPLIADLLRQRASATERRLQHAAT